MLIRKIYSAPSIILVNSSVWAVLVLALSARRMCVLLQLSVARIKLIGSSVAAQWLNEGQADNALWLCFFGLQQEIMLGSPEEKKIKIATNSHFHTVKSVA